MTLFLTAIFVFFAFLVGVGTGCDLQKWINKKETK